MESLAELDTFKQSLVECSTSASSWFFSHTQVKQPGDWDRHGGLGDSGIGAVYAFFGEASECLYVGQTTCSVKTRANFETSRHYGTEWWGQWREFRLLNVPNQTDQLILEMMLIVALAPKYNRKPAARLISAMFVAIPAT